MSTETKNKVVLVTGSSSGFGRLTVETLARKKYTVYASMRWLNGKNAPIAEEFQELASSEKLNLYPIELDVTDDASVKYGVRQVIKQTGKIDVLINNAGQMYVGVSEAFTLTQAQMQFDTNLFGVIRMNRAVLPHMRDRSSGLLVHISSIGGRIVFPFFGIYCASKFALESLAESYRYELSGLGIDSIIIEPGPYPTGLIERNPGNEDIARLEGYEKFAKIPSKMLESFQEYYRGDNSPNPQNVADAIVRLINIPAGQRPMRTVVADMDYGVNKINDFIAPVQHGLLEIIGLANLSKLHVEGAK